MGSSCSGCLNQTAPVQETSYAEKLSNTPSITHTPVEVTSTPTKKKEPLGPPGLQADLLTEGELKSNDFSSLGKSKLYNSIPATLSEEEGESKSFTDDQEDVGNKRAKFRQREHSLEVTTVKTIKETRIIEIDTQSETKSQIDTKTQVDSKTKESTELTNEKLSTEPQYPTDPVQIPKGYKFPIRAKTLPEDLTKNLDKISETSISESGSLVNKRSMETPYTRDCESPQPRPTSFATTSIMESSVIEVEPTNVTSMKFASQKLKLILDVIHTDQEVEKQTIIDSINYAIAVLDYNYQLKKKSDFPIQTLDLEETESFNESISRAPSVDDLVRSWLVSTFTRSSSRAAMHYDDGSATRGKFKSVANVIRISIMVDRFRRSLYRISIPDYLKPYFKRFCYWDFDVFDLHRVSGGHALRFVCFEALSRFGICTRFKIRRTVMEKFLNRLEEGYCINRNPYHNVVHGADVTQATIFYLAVTNLIEWLSELEIFTVIIAAAIHDFEHTGTTNNFHINTRSDLAVFYNDRSVLENYHVSATFRYMNKDPEKCIFTGLTPQEYKEMRALLIEVVLNTDMQFHFAQVKNMRTTLNLLEADSSPSSVTIDKSKVLSLIVHSCDVSHPGRNWAIHMKWTKMLCQEFFNQGDREKKLEMNVSPLCDRATTNVASSQIGFIDFIVSPTFDVVVDMVECILNPLFLQNKARMEGRLPTVEEGAEEGEAESAEPAKTEPLGVISAGASAIISQNDNEPLASAEEYEKMAENSEEETCDYIPFKWDARLQTLKIFRFYAKNIETNKANWRKHVEDEAKDPMLFKRFERDPVVELGWPDPPPSSDVEAKKDSESDSSSEWAKKLKKEQVQGDDKESRRRRRERQREKIREKERKDKKSKDHEKTDPEKKKHKEKKHKHRKSKEPKEGDHTEGEKPHSLVETTMATGGESEKDGLVVDPHASPHIETDKESVVGDDLGNMGDFDEGDQDEVIAFDERDLDLGHSRDDEEPVKQPENSKSVKFRSEQ